MSEQADPRVELDELVAAFATRLRWEQQKGREWIGAAPIPIAAPAAADAAPAAADAAPAVEAGPAAIDAAPAVEVAPAAIDAAVEAAPVTLDTVRERLGDCQRCALASGRRNLVFGVGSPQAGLMFIGEAPGRDEDLQGEPFVGAAGQLLTRMIGAMGLAREEVYIANIIKCRPPRNRDPKPEEVASCEPFLIQQIEAIAPRLIVALGNFAAKTLLRTETGITRLRGNWRNYHGIPVMPTFHPAYLLRNAGGKRAAWDDLQQVMAEMDRLGLERRKTPPKRPAR